MIFKLPEEFSVPEGTGEGDEFDSVCTFRLEAGGKACLTKLGDADVKESDSKRMEGKPDYKDYAKSMMADMQKPASQ